MSKEPFRFSFSIEGLSETSPMREAHAIVDKCFEIGINPWEIEQAKLNVEACESCEECPKEVTEFFKALHVLLSNHPI